MANFHGVTVHTFEENAIIFFKHAARTDLANCVASAIMAWISSVMRMTVYLGCDTKSFEAQPMDSPQSPKLLFQRKLPNFMAFSGERDRSNTDKTYDRAFWMYHYGFGGKLPADWDSVTRFVTWLLRSYSRRTIETYISALLSWHRENGYPDPSAAMPRGAKYNDLYVEAPKPRQDIPLSLENFRSLIKHIGDGSNLDAAHHLTPTEAVTGIIPRRALLVVALMYCGRMHISRVCNLKFEEVEVQEGTLFLNFPDGEALKKFHTFPNLTPASLLRNWQISTGLEQGYIIRSLSTNGLFEEKPASPKSVGAQINSYISTSGIDCEISCKIISLGAGLKDCSYFNAKR